MKFKKPTKEDKKEALIFVLIILGALLVFGVILIVDKINSDRAMKEYMDKALFNNGGTKLSDIINEFKSEHPLPSSSPTSAGEVNPNEILIQELERYKTKLSNGTPLISAEISTAKTYTELAAHVIIEEHNENLGAIGLEGYSSPATLSVPETQATILAYLTKLENGEDVTTEETNRCAAEISFLIGMLEILT